jgi:exodeoxyribonuclease V gamma subunit
MKLCSLDGGFTVLIELIYSNRTERLLHNLVSDLSRRRQEGAHPLDPIEIIVPNPNMEAWVTLGLARSTGVAANIHFRRLERFIGDLAELALPGYFKLADLDTIEAALLMALHDELILALPDLQPVRSYLESGAGVVEGSVFDRHLSADSLDLRRIQLASRLAYLYQEYSYSRPEMIATWREGVDFAKSTGRFGRFGLSGSAYLDPALADSSFAAAAKWQKVLWQLVCGPGGTLEKNPPASGGRWMTLDQLVLDHQFFKKIASVDLPVVHIFGISYVARIFQLLFGRLGETKTIRIYTLNPCAEFWEDVETDRELFYRLDREENSRSKLLWSVSGEPDREDPFGLEEADTPALRHWGKPGREYVRLLGELTDCDFDSEFEDPADSDRPSLLHQLQRDILFREPERVLDSKGTGLCEPDRSIRLVAAPSVRREIEWVADEIWRLLREDSSSSRVPRLRLNDIAVIVNSAARDLYLPQIEAIFSACHSLPGSFSDLPGSAGSRLIEAAGMLLRLPFGRFTRAEMLSLLSHPALGAKLEGLTPGDLAELAEKLGIIYGADRSDHAGTYVDEDVFNWDQGIRRLALGAFMTGEKSGDERIFTSADGRWLVEEVAGDAYPAAARFGLLVRSLLADARYVRQQQLTLSQWAAFFMSQVERYFTLTEARDEHDRYRITSALSRLEQMDWGIKVSGRTAAAMAERSIAELSGGKGRYLAEGVVVSSFLPMRAIPFKVVFLLGLGEGLFPAAGRRDALDLRAAKRRAGDVDPSERDRYMFLETLLCTRQKLYLSYIRRDEQTGDPLQPSAVVQELLHILKNGYLGDEGVDPLKIEPALRRYDDQLSLAGTFSDEAKVEAQIQAVAADWQRHSANPAGGDPVTGFNAIRKHAAPGEWEKLALMLKLPPGPPANNTKTITPESFSAAGLGSRETETPLTVTALRRFLECPLQGWASALLGLAETEDDQADREEEDFELARLAETTILRSAFYQAVLHDLDPGEIYNQMVDRFKLAGHFPVGEPGRVLSARHRQLLNDWQSVLKIINCGGAGLDLERLRFGRSSVAERAEKIFDPLLLEANKPDGQGELTRVPIRLSGLSEGLLQERQISISLQPSRLPENPGGAQNAAKFYRLLLRGLFDHLLLSAAGALRQEIRAVRLIYADGTGEAGFLGLKLAPITAEAARDWLAGLAGDLLSGPHAYLLPCEAVFIDFHRFLKAAVKNKAGLDLGRADANQIDRPGLLYRPDGLKIAPAISEMAGDDFASFSSFYGPVPKPRNYRPPAAEDLKAIIERRFGPLLALVLEKENF